MASAVERVSDHPLAKAIVAAATARDAQAPDVDAVQALPGLGLTARHGEEDICIGSVKFMRREGIEIPSELQSANQDETVIVLAVRGEAVATFAISDPIKSDAAETLGVLRRAGLRIAMVTGDSESAARAIAGRLGIDDVVAEVMPGEKQDAVRALRAKHGTVVFVGDGINDAPALAEADIGLAMGSGADIAIESADVILVSGAMSGVANAHLAARRTLVNIRQNLFWAFGYNTALIPIAAGVLYPVSGVLLSPMLAAGAMALSSVFVLTNALRLRRIRPVAFEASSDPQPDRAYDPVVAS